MSTSPYEQHVSAPPVRPTAVPDPEHSPDPAYDTAPASRQDESVLAYDQGPTDDPVPTHDLQPTDDPHPTDHPDPVTAPDQGVDPAYSSDAAPPYVTAPTATAPTPDSTAPTPVDPEAPQPDAPTPDPNAPGALSSSPGAPKDAVMDSVAAAGPALGPTGRPMPTLVAPPALEQHGPATVLAMCNQKGGVGKTTTTINLGAALAEHGRRVLLIDLDPQASLSVGLGIPTHELDRSIYNVLMDSDVTVDDVKVKTNVAGMDLVPSNIDLSAAEVQLVNEVAREQTLQRVLRPALADYDYILIDCQPSLGLLAVNALTAAHGVVVPLECEFFSLRGMALLSDTIDKVRERLNPEVELTGIVATMYDGRTVHSRQVMERVVEAFGDKVFHTVIARTIRFPETTVAGEPITSFAPSSPGATAYRNLALEVLAR